MTDPESLQKGRTAPMPAETCAENESSWLRLDAFDRATAMMDERQV